MIIEGNKVKIDYSIKDQKFAKCILNKLDEKYEEMDYDFHFLNKDNRYKYSIEILNSLSDFNKKTENNFDMFDLLSFNYIIRNNSIIYMLSPKIIKHLTEEEYKKSIIHEFVLAVFEKEIGKYKTHTFLTEGIAIVYAKQFNLNNLDILSYPKVKDILGYSHNGEKPDNFVFNSGNEYAPAYAWYLIMKYGFTGYLEAYKGESDVKTLIFKDFEKEAIEKFKENYK